MLFFRKKGTKKLYIMKRLSKKVKKNDIIYYYNGKKRSRR